MYKYNFSLDNFIKCHIIMLLIMLYIILNGFKGTNKHTCPWQIDKLDNHSIAHDSDIVSVTSAGLVSLWQFYCRLSAWAIPERWTPPQWQFSRAKNKWYCARTLLFSTWQRPSLLEMLGALFAIVRCRFSSTDCFFSLSIYLFSLAI